MENQELSKEQIKGAIEADIKTVNNFLSEAEELLKILKTDGYDGGLWTKIIYFLNVVDERIQAAYVYQKFSDKTLLNDSEDFSKSRVLYTINKGLEDSNNYEEERVIAFVEEGKKLLIKVKGMLEAELKKYV